MASAWAATPRNHVPRALSAFIALEGCNGRLFSSSSTQLDDDPYKVLRVPRNASFQEIKAAWVKRLITEHPDRSNLGRSVAESRTKSINEAFARIKAEWSHETKNKVSPKKAPEYAPAAKHPNVSKQEIPKAPPRASTQSSTQTSSAKTSSPKKKFEFVRPDYQEPKVQMRPEHIPRRSRAARSPLSSTATCVPGQMPTYKDRLQQQQRKDLERINVSHKLFPDGDDPCKDVGVWTLSNSTDNSRSGVFTAFPGIPESVWRPAYLRAKEQFDDEARNKLEKSNLSHLFFPEGNDPCKGLGVWIHPPEDPTKKHFVSFKDVPSSVSKPAFERARQLLVIQEMETVNLSHKLFPNGNDPCKGLGVWTVNAGKNIFTPFPGVAEKTFKPHYEKAVTWRVQNVDLPGEQVEKKKSYLAEIWNYLSSRKPRV